MRKIVYPCHLKPAVSVAGAGIYSCENKQVFLAALGEFACPCRCRRSSAPRSF
jgi:hypothetical protein